MAVLMFFKKLIDTNIETKKFSLDGLVKQCKIVKVYDGDTITANMHIFGKFYQFNIRMYGYDTPEIRNNDPEEKRKAQIAQKFLSSLLLDELVYVKCGEFDKYGRLLGEVFLAKNKIESEESVNKLMVLTGYGVAYYGGSKLFPKMI
jgi:endonuclease YncB( thermonuclease family)